MKSRIPEQLSSSDCHVIPCPEGNGDTEDVAQSPCLCGPRSHWQSLWIRFIPRNLGVLILKVMPLNKINKVFLEFFLRCQEGGREGRGWGPQNSPSKLTCYEITVSTNMLFKWLKDKSFWQRLPKILSHWFKKAESCTIPPLPTGESLHWWKKQRFKHTHP